MRLICAFIAFISVAAFAFSIVVTVGNMISVEAPLIPIWERDVIMVWTSCTAAADVLITICMLALLWHAKSQAIFGEIRNTVSRLIRLTIQTGLLTSVLALLVLPLIVQNTVLYTLPWYLLGKSYGLSILVNLNSRVPADHTENSSSGPYFSTMAFQSVNVPERSGTANEISIQDIPVHLGVSHIKSGESEQSQA